jgi:cytosine/adenosine deaminase-related metal-dependent hydrolase
MTETEIAAILAHFPNTFFCLCPRSNLFIHNTFPDISLFLKYKHRICLGTDSLASNHSLEMLAEIYAIQQRFPAVDLHTLVTWLISNGAAALLQSHHLGHFEIGKNAGIVHIQGIKDLCLTENSRAVRIV